MTASGSISEAMYVSTSNPSSFSTRRPFEWRERRRKQGKGKKERGRKAERKKDEEMQNDKGKWYYCEPTGSTTHAA